MSAVLAPLIGCGQEIRCLICPYVCRPCLSNSWASASIFVLAGSTVTVAASASRSAAGVLAIARYTVQDWIHCPSAAVRSAASTAEGSASDVDVGEGAIVELDS